MGGSWLIRICWMKKCSTLITMSNQYQHYTSSESGTWSLSLALTMTMTTTTTHIWPACADVSTGFCDGLTRRPNRLAHSIRRGETAFEAFDAWSSPIFLPFCHLLYLTRLVLWKVSEDCKDIFQTLLKKIFLCSVLILSCPKKVTFNVIHHVAKSYYQLSCKFKTLKQACVREYSGWIQSPI